MPESALAELARRCLAASTGTCELRIRDDAGSVASHAVGRFDCAGMIAEMRQQVTLRRDDFPQSVDSVDLVSAELVDESEWLPSFADARYLYLRDPDGDWLATEAPWPAGAPTAQLYWLLGAKTGNQTGVRPDGSNLEFTADFDDIVDAQERHVRAGVLLSLEYADIDASKRITGIAHIENGSLRRLEIRLDGDAPTQITVDFADWGSPQTITIPDAARQSHPEQINDLFDRLTDGNG